MCSMDRSSQRSLNFMVEVEGGGVRRKDFKSIKSMWRFLILDSVTLYLYLVWLKRSSAYSCLRGGHHPKQDRNQSGSQQIVVFSGSALSRSWGEMLFFFVLFFCINRDQESQVLSISLGKKWPKKQLGLLSVLKVLSQEHKSPCDSYLV